MPVYASLPLAFLILSLSPTRARALAKERNNEERVAIRVFFLSEKTTKTSPPETETKVTGSNES